MSFQNFRKSTSAKQLLSALFLQVFALSVFAGEPLLAAPTGHPTPTPQMSAKMPPFASPGPFSESQASKTAQAGGGVARATAAATPCPAYQGDQCGMMRAHGSDASQSAGKHHYVGHVTLLR